MLTQTLSIEKVDDYFLEHTQKLNELDKITGEKGITFLQYDVLLHLSKNDCSTPTDIANVTKASRTSVSRVLKNLESKKLIAKKYGTDINDSRIIKIETTSKGRQVAEEIGVAIVNSDLLL